RAQEGRRATRDAVRQRQQEAEGRVRACETELAVISAAARAAEADAQLLRDLEPKLAEQSAAEQAHAATQKRLADLEAIERSLPDLRQDASAAEAEQKAADQELKDCRQATAEAGK